MPIPAPLVGHAAGARGALLVAILMVTGAFFATNWSLGSGAAASFSMVPFGTPLSAQACSQLESPSNLSAELTSFYGLAALQGGQIGPNGTGALALSSYPSLAVAQVELPAIWMYICEGGQFGYAYHHANKFSGFVSGGEIGSNGHYLLFYALIWYDQCSSSYSGSDVPCQASAVWFVDLVTYHLAPPAFWNTPV
jgi:hypothetical protein